MKKLLVTGAALALALALGTSVYAAEVSGSNLLAPQATASFVDENGDGVCDNRGTGRGAGFVDEDGDGVCDNMGAGRGAGFVDEDGDGVCDNMGAGRGAGRQARRGCQTA